jgi:uncharacterized membrane protein
MATELRDLGETIGDALGKLARETVQGMSSNGHGPMRKGDGALSGARGVAAGAALAAAAPFVAKGAGKVVKGAVGKATPSAESAADGASSVKDKVAGGVKSTVGKGVKDTVGKKIDEAGGASGVAKEAGKSVLPGGGGGGDKGKKGTPGVGKGRRMPVQQAVDIAVPLSTAYNQWTQFEEWPQFMHRLDQATQEDDCTVSFKTKIWGMSKEFEGQIIEQRPDERIMWTVSKGVTHTGVVTFHQLADRLTRVQVTLDVQPGSLLEKAARGMRHVKRAVRADVSRFKAFIEMQEVETGAWRGVIHDGELVEEHDPNYDERREYAEFDDIYDTEHSHNPQDQNDGSSSRARSGGSSGSRSRSSSGGRGRSNRSSRSRSSSGGRSKSPSGSRGQSSRSSSSGRSKASASGRSRSSSGRRSSGGRSRSSGRRSSSRSGSRSGGSRSSSRS